MATRTKATQANSGPTGTHGGVIMKKGQAVVLAVLSHWDIVPETFTGAIASLFDGLLKGHPIAALRCVCDRTPALRAWADHRDGKAPFVVKAIITRWKELGASKAVKERNNEVLPGLSAVYLVGPLMHRTAFEILKKALVEGLPIFQADSDGGNVTKVESPASIVCGPGFEFGELTTLRNAGAGAVAESEVDLWNRLAGEKKARKEK
jgi:hypothetical protein